jgi:SPP1 gp7 family putative phage head morphogenesis protein
MSKTKITPKMLKQTKLIQKETQRVTEQNYKAIAKVFRDFGNETEKQFAKITMQDLKWDILKSRLDIVLSTNSKRSTKSFVNFLNKLFDFKLKTDKIESVENETVNQYAKGLAKKVTYVTETTKNQIASLIDNNKGLNTNDLAKLINEKFVEISKGRAKTISRTESANLFNNANLNTAKEVGMKYKVYMHGVNSPNERPHHRALNGTKIKFDEKFVLNGIECDTAHDNSLPAREVCNCSCIVSYSNR